MNDLMLLMPPGASERQSEKLWQVDRKLLKRTPDSIQGDSPVQKPIVVETLEDLLDWLLASIRYDVLVDADINLSLGLQKARTRSLKPRNCMLLQILFRADALVMQAEVEKTVLSILMSMTSCASLVAYMVLEDVHLTADGALCMLDLLCLIVFVVVILNLLVEINQTLQDDSLKILQSWKERLDHICWAVISDWQKGGADGDKSRRSAERTGLESYFRIQTRPLDEMMTLIRNWNHPVSVFSIAVTSARRNQIAVPLLSCMLYAAWRECIKLPWVDRLNALRREVGGIYMS